MRVGTVLILNVEEIDAVSGGEMPDLDTVPTHNPYDLGPPRP